MSALAVAGWVLGAVSSVCAAAGWWHRRRGAARLARGAHELRGPLGAIRLGLDLGLARGGLPLERLRALDLQLDRATLALAELELPGRGRCESGRVGDPVQVAELLRHCVAALGPVGAERGVRVEGVDLGRLRDTVVSGSRARLAQALSNLIQNAIEHGAGPVHVHARVEEGTVRLEVTDHGPGLPAPLVSFLNAGRGPGWAAATGRHGHGLRVAAAVAAAHGGRLLSAPSDLGARLVLELPLAGRSLPGSPAARRAE